MKTPDGRELLFTLRAGSHLHGTAIKDSDVDLRGVCLPLPEEAVGLRHFEQEERNVPGEDYVYYDLRKYVNLLLEGNMNVFDWVLAPANVYSYINNPTCFDLRALGKSLLSQRYARAVYGYLTGALRRLEAGKMNTRRREVQLCGYDSKDFAHAVRLARQCREVFNLGFPVVCRDRKLQPDGVPIVPDAEELICLRTNPLPKDQALAMLMAEQEKAREAEKENRAKVPQEPQFSTAQAFVMRVLKGYLLSGT